MDKVINHIKANIAIYLIIIVTIVLSCVIAFRKPATSSTSEIEYDTSMFNVVDLNGANELFNSNKNQLLFVGRKTCAVCQEFIKSLQIAVSRDDFYVSYLDLDDIDRNSAAYREFKSKLDYEYTYNSVTAPFGDYIGSTPMIIIIKNNKMAFGILGSMSSDTILTLVNQYGLNK